LVASIPSSRGIITSMTTASGVTLPITASASAPSAAVTTSNSLNSRERRSESRTARSSSTTNTRIPPHSQRPVVRPR
jgi:hypothetical protein